MRSTKSSCVLLVVLFSVVLTGLGVAGGRARVFNDGQGVAKGVEVQAQTYVPAVEGSSASGGSSGEARYVSSLQSESEFFVSNRCSATNVGGGFSYSFANGVECASFSAPVPQDPVRPGPRRPRAPSPEEVAARLIDRAVALAPTPELEVAPSRVGLAGLRTFFWLDEPPQPIVATAAAGPATVTAVADPVQYLWDFGDGGDRLTETSGTAWRSRGRGSIGHVYQASGRYELDVEVIWQARWRSGGGSWQPLGYFSTSDSRPYTVREVIAWLVRQR